MTAAEIYVEHFYRQFPGRVPLSAGWSKSKGHVFPFVFEDESGRPIGIVSMAANEAIGDATVQVYLISAFLSRNGHGSRILKALCAEADERHVELLLQAELLGADESYFPPPEKLKSWYRSFGFIGTTIMARKPANREVASE